MKFLCVFKPAKPEGAPHSDQEFIAMAQLIDEQTKAGVLLATGGCLPSALGARIRLTGDQFNVTDGPFTESKELIAGFALLEVKSKAEAIRYVKDFLKVAGDGETELRQLFELPMLRPDSAEGPGHEYAWKEEFEKQTVAK